jgi:uncharacterized protein YegP (UPF0339 family)
MPAKFEISKDVSGEFRFKLVVGNSQTVAVSQGYKSKDGALKGIESIKENTAKAVIEDKTV